MLTSNHPRTRDRGWFVMWFGARSRPAECGRQETCRCRSLQPRAASSPEPTTARRRPCSTAAARLCTSARRSGPRCQAAHRGNRCGLRACVGGSGQDRQRLQLCFHEDVYLVATLRAVGKSLKGPEGLGSVLAALLTAQIRSMITLTYQNAHTALRPSALHGLGGVERVRGALAPREVFLSPLNPSVAGHYCKGMSIHGSTLTAWSRPPSNRIPSPSPQKTSGGQRDTRTSGKFAASVASERF